jgi:hypothetical protein
MARQLTLVAPGLDFSIARSYPVLRAVLDQAAAVNEFAVNDFEITPEDYDLRIDPPSPRMFPGMPQASTIREAYEPTVNLMVDQLAAIIETELGSRRRRPIVAMLEMFRVVHTRLAHFPVLIDRCYRALADAVAAVGMENVLLLVPCRPVPVSDTHGLCRANSGGAYYVRVTGEGFDLFVSELGGAAVVVRGAAIPELVLTYEGLVKGEIASAPEAAPLEEPEEEPEIKASDDPCEEPPEELE